MKKIDSRGNAPEHIGIFLKQLGGVFNQVKGTEVWEAATINEMESKAVEIGFELIPTLDNKTGRAYLVGFDARDSVIVSASNEHYSQLIMYFIELTPEQLKAWDKKIKQHRKDQLEDLAERRKINKKTKPIGIRYLEE